MSNLCQMVKRENLFYVIKNKAFTEEQKSRAFKLYCELAKAQLTSQLFSRLTYDQPKQTKQ